MSLAKTFLALTYLAVKSILKYFFVDSSLSLPEAKDQKFLDSGLSLTKGKLGVVEGRDIEKKMNSTTDDEAYSSSSSSSSIASTSYYSQSSLNVSTPSSILPIVNHEIEIQQVSCTSEREEIEEQEVSSLINYKNSDEILSQQLKKDLSLHVEELYERLQGRVDIHNDYIQNIIKTSIIKYFIKQSINSNSFKYFNEVSLDSNNNNINDFFCVDLFSTKIITARFFIQYMRVYVL